MLFFLYSLPILTIFNHGKYSAERFEAGFNSPSYFSKYVQKTTAVDL
jgi:hypothetical protein